MRLSKQENELVKNAILKKREIEINFKYGLGNELKIPFHPLILGEDTMQYEFIYAYLPHSNIYYKLFTDFIITIVETRNSFEIPENAEYRNAIEEEHYIVNDDFKNIWS
jgi:hypothetical protein